MEIGAIGHSPLPLDLARKKYAAQQPGQFSNLLSTAIQEVSQLQSRADDMAARLALTKDVDVHDAVIAAEEASLAFQYTLQVRNKLIEAYQEVMRMQV